MAENKCNESYRDRPIEKHNTAAWANIEETKEDSKVTIPSDEQVDNARDYVNDNQK